MVERRVSSRSERRSPITIQLSGLEAEAILVNLSGTGALVRFAENLPFGPAEVGQSIRFVHGHDVGALLRPQARIVRYFEDAEGKNLGVRFEDG